MSDNASKTKKARNKLTLAPAGLVAALLCTGNLLLAKPSAYIRTQQDGIYEDYATSRNATLLGSSSQAAILALSKRVQELEQERQGLLSTTSNSTDSEVIKKIELQILRLQGENKQLQDQLKAIGSVEQSSLPATETIEEKVLRLRSEKKKVVTATKKLRKENPSNSEIDELDQQFKSLSKELKASVKLKNKDRVFANFMSHIPKSGASYANQVINALTIASNEWKVLPIEEQFVTCNVGVHPLEKLHEFTDDLHGVKCNMWMSEKGYSDKPNHIYTIIREPKAHTLSMYFHCAESKDHANRAQFMPSLDDWLGNWSGIIDDETKLIDPIQRAQFRKDYKCYDPINFQSEFVQFDPDGGGKEDLKNRYDVVGINDQMDKSICMIVIRYTGWVPKECDCTQPSVETNLTAKDPSAELLSGEMRLRYDKARDAHSVKHHGADYETSESQEAAITKIRETDMSLYEVANEVFQEQAKEIEDEYQIQLCDKFRIRDHITYFKSPVRRAREQPLDE